MPLGELNKILLHVFPNSWAKQAYIQGWGFEVKFYKDTCEMFKRMDIAETIYEWRAPSKNTQQEESDCASSVKKKKGGASTSPSNSEQGCAGKSKRNNAGHPCDEQTGTKNTFLLHVPRRSSEECKLLKTYTEKRSAHHTYKDKQAHTGSNKHAKTVKFDYATQEVTTMKSHDETTPKNKKGGNQKKKTRSN